jgi:hypothetical protein
VTWIAHPILSFRVGDDDHVAASIETRDEVGEADSAIRGFFRPVVNQLRQSTSVHWHGMELESYYDGVPGWGARGKELTPVIKPGGSFVVRFTPPRVGAFMYHTHLNDEAQISGGLYGPLIVVESAEKVDRHYRF